MGSEREFEGRKREMSCGRGGNRLCAHSRRIRQKACQLQRARSGRKLPSVPVETDEARLLNTGAAANVSAATCLLRFQGAYTKPQRRHRNAFVQTRLNGVRSLLTKLISARKVQNVFACCGHLFDDRPWKYTVLRFGCG